MIPIPAPTINPPIWAHQATACTPVAALSSEAFNSCRMNQNPRKTTAGRWTKVMKNPVSYTHLDVYKRQSYATVGAPVMIMDGLRGRSYHDVNIKGKHFDSRCV